MEPKLIHGDRGGHILAINGHRYHRHRATGEAIHWRCWRKTCRARVRTNIFNPEDPAIHIIFWEDHGHGPVDHMIERATFREKMRSSIDDQPTTPVRRVYDAAVSSVSRQGGGDRPPRIDAFSSFRTILNRARSKRMPEIPRGVEEVEIQGPWAETWQQEEYLLHKDNDWEIAIFATKENLRALSQCRKIYMDGTFKSCPGPYSQIFTILGQYRGWVIPLVTCMMGHRQVGHYRAVLKAIALHVRQISHRRWRPQKVVCDFEIALITALQSELPQVSIQGCYFHFTQSLWRRVQELGLVRAYRENLSLRKCIRKLMALGYLPRPLVRLNFNSLRRSQRTIRLIDRNPSLLDFFGYVQNTYIGGFFPVPLWNVFDREMDTRTNNHVESYHKTLNDTIGVRHPSLWTFIRCLKDRQTVVEQTIDGAERGELAPARRRKWRVLEERLR
uniref:MULE transposase domain-containing protein n=1 Tax=Knipowitschia caucasica TaxID=637954 RepID=A0AAV2J7G9_KNICA